MIMAVTTLGTYSRVSFGSAFTRYRYQKLRCLIGSRTVFITACLTFEGPRLYAANANMTELPAPKSRINSRRKRQLARVDFARSVRSSTCLSTRKPNVLAVAGVNCHGPRAPAALDWSGARALST